MKRYILFFLSLIVGCNYQSHKVQGTIIEVRHKTYEFLIHHDEIPGFMTAMTMPFKVKNSLDIEKFIRGDSVHFELIMNNNNTIATNFILKGKGTINSNDKIWNDAYTPLEIGEIISDVSFLNLDSNTVFISESDGKFRFISFIFTRCPMPNMCPAVVAKNQYLAEKFYNNSNIEFILISFDYIYDTPLVMKSMYSNQTSSYKNITFYSSVGHLNDIFSIASQSSVSFWGIEENDIGHTLRSIILDPERRLMKVYDGTDWRPRSAESDIHNLLKTYN